MIILRPAEGDRLNTGPGGRSLFVLHKSEEISAPYREAAGHAMCNLASLPTAGYDRHVSGVARGRSSPAEGPWVRPVWFGDREGASQPGLHDTA